MIRRAEFLVFLCIKSPEHAIKWIYFHSVSIQAHSETIIVRDNLYNVQNQGQNDRPTFQASDQKLEIWRLAFFVVCYIQFHWSLRQETFFSAMFRSYRHKIGVSGFKTSHFAAFYRHLVRFDTHLRPLNPKTYESDRKTNHGGTPLLLDSKFLLGLEKNVHLILFLNCTTNGRSPWFFGWRESRAPAG